MKETLSHIKDILIPTKVDVAKQIRLLAEVKLIAFIGETNTLPRAEGGK